jgi:hypothetical protein
MTCPHIGQRIGAGFCPPAADGSCATSGRQSAKQPNANNAIKTFRLTAEYFVIVVSLFFKIGVAIMQLSAAAMQHLASAACNF